MRPGRAAYPDDHLGLGQQRVQVGCVVARQTGRQHLGLPGAGRQHRPGQPLQGEQHLVGIGAGPVVELVTGREEPREGALRDRTQFAARGGETAGAHPAQDFGVDKFGFGHTQAETTTGQSPGADLAVQQRRHGGHPEPEDGGNLADGERAVSAGVAGDQLGERVASCAGGWCGMTGRDRDAQRVPQDGKIAHRHQLGSIGDPDRRHAGVQRIQCRIEVGQLHPFGQRRQRQRAQQSRQFGQVVWGLGPAARGGVLQFGDHLGHHVGVQQLAQVERAQGCRQQLGVYRQHRGPAFSERGVAVVEERAGVPEEQSGGERARLVGDHLDQPGRAGSQAAHQFHQAGQIVDVLGDLADGFDDDREARVVPGHLQQLGGALALLPKRRTSAGVAAR